jgi:hypothetical protein
MSSRLHVTCPLLWCQCQVSSFVQPFTGQRGSSLCDLLQIPGRELPLVGSDDRNNRVVLDGKLNVLIYVAGILIFGSSFIGSPRASRATVARSIRLAEELYYLIGRLEHY